MLMFPLFSLTARAEDYSAKLNSLNFDIALQEDGSAYITETREIVFTGDHEFTRYGVNNIFSGPRVFSDWLVSIDGTLASQLDEPDNENRPENTFAVEDNDDGNSRARCLIKFWLRKKSWPTAQKPGGRKRSVSGPSGKNGKRNIPFCIPSSSFVNRFAARFKNSWMNRVQLGFFFSFSYRFFLMVCSANWGRCCAGSK